MREIIGNTTATTNPQPDWEQTNAAAADYIKNKPDLSKYVTVDAEEQTIEGFVKFTNSIEVDAIWVDSLYVFSGEDSQTDAIYATYENDKLAVRDLSDAEIMSIKYVIDDSDYEQVEDWTGHFEFSDEITCPSVTTQCCNADEARIDCLSVFSGDNSERDDIYTTYENDRLTVRAESDAPIMSIQYVVGEIDNENPQRTRGHFEMDHDLEVSGHVNSGVFCAIEDMTDYSWSTSYGYEDIQVTSDGKTNNFQFPTGENAGGTIATQEWVKNNLFSNVSGANTDSDGLTFPIELGYAYILQVNMQTEDESGNERAFCGNTCFYAMESAVIYQTTFCQIQSVSGTGVMTGFVDTREDGTHILRVFFGASVEVPIEIAPEYVTLIKIGG